MDAHSATGVSVPERTSLLTINEACEYLRVSRWTIYRMVDRGDLLPLRVGSRFRFRLAELDRYLERAGAS
jgi:excisionase family DNA binding protein